MCQEIHKCNFVTIVYNVFCSRFVFCFIWPRYILVIQITTTTTATATAAAATAAAATTATDTATAYETSPYELGGLELLQYDSLVSSPTLVSDQK